MWPGLVVLESKAAQVVANAGISLSTVLNVQLLFLLTVLCSWAVLKGKILIASAILKGTATTSTKERCAWDSGSVIVKGMEMLTPSPVGFQCPGSLWKKFPNLRPRFRDRTSSPAKAF